MSTSARLPEIAGTFFKLGCTSFGGPVAHLGYFREEFVVKRGWLDDAAYADLVALCQFLPGPASSQVVFALGMRRAGLAGALVAAACFTAPSALLMILFAYRLAAMGDPGGSGWVHGLRLAAVAVVAQAVWGMGRKLCPDATRATLALVAAVAVVSAPNFKVQVAVIAAGAVAGWSIYRRAVPLPELEPVRPSRKLRWAVVALGVFLGLLIALPMLTTATGRRDFRIISDFYRAGALVFGGGHVVLPLLRAQTVPPGWISDDMFMAGYGAAQALPGPLFTFAAFLGTAMMRGPQAWLGGLGCLLAIFLPGWLLVGGVLPFWHNLRGQPWARAALRGANAAVVGVLLAALYNPVWQDSVTNAVDVLEVVVAFGLLHIWRVPAWGVVGALALLGAVLA